MEALQYDGTRSETKANHEAKDLEGEGRSEVAEGYTPDNGFIPSIFFLLKGCNIQFSRVRPSYSHSLNDIVGKGP